MASATAKTAAIKRVSCQTSRNLRTQNIVTMKEKSQVHDGSSSQQHQLNKSHTVVEIVKNGQIKDKTLEGPGPSVHKKSNVTQKEKFYKCQKCGEIFGSGYLLTIHAKRCQLLLVDNKKEEIKFANELISINKENVLNNGSILVKEGKKSTSGSSSKISLDSKDTASKDHTYVQPTAEVLNPFKSDPDSKLRCSDVSMTLDQQSLQSEVMFATEKPYSCGICHQGFYQRNQLRRHSWKHSHLQSYSCGRCGKYFRDKTTLTVHKRGHLREPPFMCAFCDKSFNLLNMLKYHNKNTHNVTYSASSNRDGYNGAEVQKLCQPQALLQQHTVSTHAKTDALAADIPTDVKPPSEQHEQPEQISSLDVRRKVTKRVIEGSSSDYRQNPRKPHEMKTQENHYGRTHPCGSCNKVLRSSVALKIHKENCGNSDFLKGMWNFKCRLCDTKVKFWSLLQVHMKRHRSCQYKCTQCKKAYLSRKELKSHLASVHQSIKFRRKLKRTGNILSCLCPICGKLFKTRNSMKIHVATHTDKKPFKCDECSKSFALKNYLNRHKLIHAARTKDYTCDICDKAFSNKAGLKAHVKTHSGEKPFACPLCDKTFTTNAALPGHMRIHTGEKPYSCKICDRRFVLKSALSKHMLTHDKVRPYQCDQCDMSYITQQQLDRHLNGHIGLKPFECEVCQRKFTQKYSLKNHMMIHTDSKPFICEECGKSFRNPSGLREHRNHHTGEKPYKCPYCGTGFSTSGNRRYHIKVYGEGRCTGLRSSFLKQSKWQRDKMKEPGGLVVDDPLILSAAEINEIDENNDPIIIEDNADNILSENGIVSVQPVISKAVSQTYNGNASHQSNSSSLVAHQSESDEEPQWDVETYQIDVGSIDPHGNEAAILESLQNCLEAHQAKNNDYSINISELVPQDGAEDGAAIHLNRAMGQSIDLGDTQIIFVEQDVASMGDVVIIP